MTTPRKIVTVDGELLGQLVPAEGQFMFFTTHQNLLDLHGRSFQSYESLYEEIATTRNRRLKPAA